VGLVVPEVEQVVSSPIDARVVRILRRAGAAVKAGDAILELDTLPQRLAVDRLRQQIALKENQQARTRLDLEARLNDLESEGRIKQLQLESFRSRLDRVRQLQENGLVSNEDLQQSELAVSQTEVELVRIESEQRAARAATAATLEGLRMELTTARDEAAEAERLLRLAALRAERPGVVTWTLTEEGGTSNPVVQVKLPEADQVVDARTDGRRAVVVVDQCGQWLSRRIVVLHRARCQLGSDVH
jgi:HlyD family secretion protein